jgi:hypothetical protein
MGKSGRDSSTGKLGYIEPSTVRLTVEPEVKVDSGSKPLYNKKVVSVLLRSLYDARLEYTGQATGKQYVWKSAGSIIPVDVEDSYVLLAKRIGGKSCCGNSKDGQAIFDIPTQE